MLALFFEYIVADAHCMIILKQEQPFYGYSKSYSFFLFLGKFLRVCLEPQKTANLIFF